MTSATIPGREALDFAAEIAGLDTVEAVLAAFSSVGGEYGYSTFALGELPAPETQEFPDFFVSTWPDHWIETYVAEGLAADDPSVEHARVGILPASWAELRQRAGADGRGMRTARLAAEHGWPEGLVIPIHGPRGYRGVVSMAGETVDLPVYSRLGLQQIALHLHERLKQMLAPGSASAARLPTLSAGEIECILWLIAGKTDWEMGQILGISEATAHWRIEQAKKKFAVRTRAQLTALAVAYGHVTP